MDTITRRRPVSVLDTVQLGTMKSSTLKAQRDLEKMRPEHNYGLGIAKVVNLDYEEFLVTLRTLIGASQVYDRVPVPLTFPGAGNRHFLGAMPQIGDYCVVGWLPQESQDEKATKSPVILAWIIPSSWAGREWLTLADFEVDEYDFEAPRDQAVVEGVHDRIRHKLRHIQPGNIVASSSQGADLVLDEGVSLANRRGNEIRLRDQDQALVTRSLQQFHAMAGARVYAGMVQRDASFLPTTMVSDGFEWDGGLQSIDGQPISDSDLPADPKAPVGFLTPARIFRKSSLDEEEGYIGRSLFGEDSSLDPYKFLRRGGFITEAGYALDTTYQYDAVYGGKPIYRVAAQTTENAVLDPDLPTLTEYRIEVAHTSDGRLPVTEQTDLFDAERLPQRDLDVAEGEGLPANRPFLEWVMGSVVGNDPFTQEGRRRYGKPLTATIFEGEQAVPRLDAASVPLEGTGINPTPMGDHLAHLFKLTPPTATGGVETFWGVNKKGQIRAAIGGSPRESSVEAYLHGGLKLGVGGEFKLLLNGHVDLGTLSKSSLRLAAEEGPVKIFGGGPVADQSRLMERLTGTGQGDGDVPAVDIEARTNARIKAEKTVFLKGNAVDMNATSINMMGQQDISINGIKKVDVTTESYQLAVNGKRQDSYSGPKQLLPTNAPLHERTYVPNYPGIVCEKVDYVQGDREELFGLGNHKTTILIGNLSHDVVVGKWSARATTSSVEMSAAGITGTALAGTVTLSATAGTATMTGQAGVNLIATGGPAQVRGSAGVFLGAPITGPDAGPIICAGTLEPFTNLPFATWGLGAKNHLVVG